jgi:hypothetical protein
MSNVTLAPSSPAGHPILNTSFKCRKFEESIRRKRDEKVKMHYGRNTKKTVLSLRFMASD